MCRSVVRNLLVLSEPIDKTRGMTSIPWPLMCHDCAHVGEENDRGNWTCRAFPFGIPSAIRNGSVDHRTPVIGDRGFQFEPDPEAGYDDERWQRFHQKLDERAARYAEHADRAPTPDNRPSAPVIDLARYRR